MLNRHVLHLLQGLVTGGLLIHLFQGVNWEQLYSLFVTSRWDYIALSIVLLGLNHILNVCRWSYLLQERHVSYRTLFVYYGAGLFSSNFLPTGIGGDGIRVFLLSRRVAPARALLSVLWDRGIGTLALSALLIVTLCLGLPPGVATIDEWVMSFFSVERIISTSGLVITSVGFFGFLAWKFFQSSQSKGSKILSTVTDLFTKVPWVRGAWWRIFTGGYAISVVSHLGIVAAHWAVIEAFSISVPVAAVAWLVLVGALAFMVPISINGIGLQESVYVGLLGCYGVSTSMAFGVAVMMRLLLTFFSLIGGILSLKERLVSTREEAADS